MLKDIAGQLGPRPSWQHGRSYNPKLCPHCGHQADWHSLEGILTEAYHRGQTHEAAGRVPLTSWANICGQGQGVAWPRTYS